MAMRAAGYCLFLITFLLNKALLSQELSYKRYDTKDGLAGSIAYCMKQDKEGFLWIGTENGLSRFDGTRFVNYTVLDGLPDNEVLNLFPDSRGRLWIMAFKPSVCYYYKGKIYNSTNDAVLSKVKPRSNIWNIAEDSEGNILLQEYDLLHLIKPDGNYVSYLPNETNTRYVTIAKRTAGGFWMWENNGIKILENSSFSNYWQKGFYPGSTSFVDISGNFLAYRSSVSEVTLETIDSSSLSAKFAIPKHFTRLMLVNDSILVLCSKAGVSICTLNEGRRVQTFLTDKTINAAFIDNEGNWWFCSSRQGIFKLNSRSVKNFSLKEKDNRPVGVSSIAETHREVLLGSELNSLFKVNRKRLSAEKVSMVSFLEYSKADIVDLLVLPDQSIIYGAGTHIAMLDKNYKLLHIKIDVSIKEIAMESQNTVLVATNNCVARFDLREFKFLDTLWFQRATTLFLKSNGDMYIGTLNGLYLLKPDKSIFFMGDSIPQLKNRINSIVQTKDGLTWAASYGGGLVAFDGFKLVHYLTTGDGLTSNLCKTLFAKDLNLWVGTDKGLNKIDLSGEKLAIARYSSADGLASDNINTVYADDSVVFVGSPAGLSIFREQDIQQQSSCALRVTGIRVNNEYFAYDSTNFVLPRSRNNILFEYVGISYRSVGDVKYRYRLLGLDSNWQTTNSLFLSYPSLPSGEYKLQLQAVNKFEVPSQIVSTSFAIAPLIWERTWFRLLLGGLSLCLITLLIWYLTQRVRKREEEKTRINARIAELEQLALKSQMNPHFIFNSLNSIQQYVMDKDVSGANKFISGFSRLIRQTLDFSSKPLVHLQDEIGYLQTYLELEKNRLEEKFNYEVEVSEELRNEDYYIPPMVLQPFLENSLRHGIRYRKDNEGRVKIRVYKGYQQIVCVIEDNGVGREQAARNKRANPIEYQSKGMTLTANRIDLINKDRQKKIKVQIEDLFHADGSAAGTRVTVSFPEEMS
jgi:ligand-binding sensor domain-containing protein